MKRTKIICTVGPSSESAAILEAMVRSGMNVARLNFSHGTQAWHRRAIRTIRAISRKLGEPVAILADLQGPKIRVGVLPEKGIELKNGETIALPVTYAALHKDLKKGDRIIIEDGIMETTFVSGKRGEVTVRVVNGGTVFSHKGMNFPDSTLRVPALTPKDKEDAAFAVKEGVDWIALSFVTSPKDVRALRRTVAGASKPSPKIMVKIEKHEALDCFEGILAEADGVMIARGDLGVETPAEEVPVRQKEMIGLCRLAGKPVVVATQMLDSMIRNPRPTRAEVSDVANAVCDHADAVMLSGESASGKYPKQAVAMMAKIIAEAEASPFDDVPLSEHHTDSRVADISHALKTLAIGGHIHGVVASKQFAEWSDELLMMRPELPLFLGCASETEARQANVRWGVRPFVLRATTPTGFARHALVRIKARRWVKKGMRIAVIVGEGFDVVDVE